MKPRGPLMIEHRLIEKMFKQVEAEVGRIKAEKKAHLLFIDAMVDFVRIYADRTHHGKEEDILFRELAKKEMTVMEQRAMEALVEDHKYARKTVKELVEAKEAYFKDSATALGTITEKLETLAKFYPEHIRKEDKEFFPSTERYFSQKELDVMLVEFWEFDRRMIHEKYRQVVESLALAKRV